jgi:hypothetical protein
MSLTSPPAGERRTDRRAAKAVWILELPGSSGTIHLMHHCPGFACSCHDVKTSGAVHTSFIVKLSANWPTSNCCAVQHDSEYGAVYPRPGRNRGRFGGRDGGWQAVRGRLFGQCAGEVRAARGDAMSRSTPRVVSDDRLWPLGDPRHQTSATRIYHCLELTLHFSIRTLAE